MNLRNFLEKMWKFLSLSQKFARNKTEILRLSQKFSRKFFLIFKSQKFLTFQTQKLHVFLEFSENF